LRANWPALFEVKIHQKISKIHVQCPPKKSPDHKKMDAVLERSAAALLMVVLITAFYEKGQE
jgi:hypothetical protein